MPELLSMYYYTKYNIIMIYNIYILKATTRAFRDGPPRRGLIVLLFFYDNDIINIIYIISPQSPRRLHTAADRISIGRDSIRTYKVCNAQRNRRE